MPDVTLSIADVCSCCTPPPFDCANCLATSWTITFTGVLNTRPCSGCAAFGYVMAGSGTLGTYTLTAIPVTPCSWGFSGTGPTVFYNGGGGDDIPPCSDTWESDGTLDIRLSVSSAGFHLYARTYISFVGAYLYFFEATIPDTRCCVAQSFNNSQVAYDGPDVCTIGGINGTALATPSC